MLILQGLNSHLQACMYNAFLVQLPKLIFGRFGIGRSKQNWQMVEHSGIHKYREYGGKGRKWRREKGDIYREPCDGTSSRRSRLRGAQ